MENSIMQPKHDQHQHATGNSMRHVCCPNPNTKVRLDQHMMVDTKTIRKIVSLARLSPGDTVLEIGAGSGNLTRELVDAGARVTAIEIDKKFEPELRKIRNVEVIIGNALKIIGSKPARKGGLIRGVRPLIDRIVSNLPYAICEPLFRKLPFCDFKLAILTVPKGFAYRLLSGKSKLSLLMQEFFDVKVMMDIPKKAFEPEPGTNSVVVSLKFRAPKTLLSMVLLQPKFKVKNAIKRVLIESKKMTKNQAKKHLKSLKINNKLLEKTVRYADLEDFKALKKAL